MAVKPDGWFTDPCIQTVPLPALKKGESELILEMAFGKKTNTEWCYLLGDFGVEVRGCHSTVVAKPDHLVYGSVVPQGLPFYGEMCIRDSDKTVAQIVNEIRAIIG